MGHTALVDSHVAKKNDPSDAWLHVNNVPRTMMSCNNRNHFEPSNLVSVYVSFVRQSNKSLEAFYFEK